MNETTTIKASSSPLQKILKTVEDLYNNYKDSQQNREDLVHFFEDKLPLFVERSLREIEARRTSKVLIEQCVHSLHELCVHKYLYNKQQNAFYEIQDMPISLQLISSDHILIALCEKLPSALAPHRAQILKMVRTRLQSQDVFQWTPPKAIIQRMTNELLRNFNTLDEAEFFMKLIGAIVNHKEDMLYTDEQKTSIIHLWFGERVEEVIECAQRVLYNATRTLSPFWNKVKRRMHRTYPFENIHFIAFPSITHKNPFRIIKQSPILFLATCSSLFLNEPMFMQNVSSAVCRLKSIVNAPQLFSHYVHKNIILTNEGHTATNQRFLLIHEIFNDFVEYLVHQSLPIDTITKQDILQSVYTQIQSETYGTRGTKRLYYATFRISTGETLHELFLRFCGTMLFSEDDANQKASSVVQAIQLHNNYRMWCKHYVATNDDVDGDACHSGQLQSRHWYCSYKLFTAMLRKQFGQQEHGYCIHIKPSADIWKLYLEKYNNDNVKDTLSDWVHNEFGIQINAICQASKQDTYDEGLTDVDMHEIHKHIESLCQNDVKLHTPSNV